MRRAFRRLFVVAMVFIAGCGEPPGNTPVTPPIVWTGSLTIDARILTDAGVIQPDSIRLEFNLADSGLVANPITLNDLPEGSYDVAVSARYNFISYSSPSRRVNVVYRQINRYEPELLPANIRGALRVAAHRDGVPAADSVYVWIDRIDFGLGANPRVIGGLSEGSHSLIVTSKGYDFQGSSSDAIVIADDTSGADVAVDSIGVEIGDVAPDILAQNDDGEVKLLSAERGKITFLYFFEYT